MTPPRTVSLLLAVAPLAGCALEGYDPSEYLAYPALEDLAPLPGAPTLWDLTGANWTAIFVKLVAESLARAPETPKHAAKKFDVLYGMGLQKSGTSSFHVAANRMGYRKHKKGAGNKQNNFRHVYEAPGRPADERFHKLWYQDGHLSASQVASLKQGLDDMTLFEDDPWFVLHRLADAHYGATKRRVGYVLTVRDCAAMAESSAAFNNPTTGLGNSDAWNREHCHRHYRRCMVHLLDAYHFLRDRALRTPLDDVLVLPTTAKASKANWRALVDFAYDGGRAVYGNGTRRDDPARTKVLRDYADMPHANERDRKKRRTYCDGAALEAYARATRIGGDILAGLQPPPPNFGHCSRAPQLPACVAMAHPGLADRKAEPEPPKRRKAGKRTNPPPPPPKDEPARGKRGRDPKKPAGARASPPPPPATPKRAAPPRPQPATPPRAGRPRPADAAPRAGKRPRDPPGAQQFGRRGGRPFERDDRQSAPWTKPRKAGRNGRPAVIF